MTHATECLLVFHHDKKFSPSSSFSFCEAFWMQERSKEVLLQQQFLEDKDRIIGELLFDENKRDWTKVLLYNSSKILEKKRKVDNTT